MCDEIVDIDDIDDSAWWPLTWGKVKGKNAPIAPAKLGENTRYVFDTRGIFGVGSRWSHDFLISSSSDHTAIDDVYVYGDELALRCALIELYRKLNPRR
jgi:hypothetical protein